MTPDLPKYTTWDAIPEGLYTKTQLGALDPPRRLLRCAEPVGRVLYHGNKYAKLYSLSATELKPPATTAQLASVRRAAAARHICRRCDARTHPSVTPDSPPAQELDLEPYVGRMCLTCTRVLRALRQHHDYRRAATRIVGGELATRGAIVIQADDPDEPRYLVLIEFTDLPQADDCEILFHAPLGLVPPGTDPSPGQQTYREAMETIDQVMTARYADPARPVPVFVGWGQSPLWPVVMLANHDLSRAQQHARYEADGAAGLATVDRFWPHAAAKSYPWMQQRQEPWREVPGIDQTVKVRSAPLLEMGLQARWAWYYSEPHSGVTDADSMRFYHPSWHMPHPGLTGDVLADAHLMVRTLAGIADGTEPVSPRAPWLAFPPQPGYVDTP